MFDKKRIEELKESYPLGFSRLSRAKRENFFRVLEITINKLIESSPDFSSWFHILGSENAEIVKSAILYSDFRTIDEGDSRYKVLLKFASKKADVARNIARYYLDHSKSRLGFKPYEAVMIKSFLGMALIIDRIYIDWREEMLNSEAGKKIIWLESEKQGKGSEWVKEMGLTNQYSVIVKEGDKFVQIPNKTYFASDYADLEAELKELIKKLNIVLQDKNYEEEDKSEIENLIAYFEAFLKGIQCVNLDKMDEVWEAVDIKWVALKGKILPVHPMEYNYTDPGRIRVIPEIRLLMEDTKYEDVNEGCAATKKGILTHIGGICEGRKLTKRSIEQMSKVDMRIFVTAIYGGSFLCFRFVGESIPNRDKVRLSYGTKISLDVEAMSLRKQKAMVLLKKVIKDVKLVNAFDKLDVKEVLYLFIAGHEVGHAGFSTEETGPKIGSGLVPLLEEAKASCLGLAVLKKRVEAGELDKAVLKRIALNLFLYDGVRTLAERGNTTLEPYYFETQYFMGVMLDTGFLHKVNSNWTLDFSKLDDLYRGFDGLFQMFIDIYDNYDKDKASEFVNRYNKEREELLEIYKILIA